MPGASIAKPAGCARGGSRELALALDLRLAMRTEFKLRQTEVGMWILPCGGGVSCRAQQTGLGRALGIILGASNDDADEAEAMRNLDRALQPEEINAYNDSFAKPDISVPARCDHCLQADGLRVH
ncbi:MAG: hypothetical protein AAF636_04545 [Pseudomonadota bacterium]